MNTHTTLSKSDSNVAEERTPLLPSSSSPQGSSAEKNTTKRAKKHDRNPPLEPAQALTPLVTGGIIQTTDGATLTRRPRPPPLAKSVPAAPPSPLKARHKTQFLYRLNEFRHSYKNTRLALKFGGLAMLANESWAKMASYSPVSHKSLRKMGKKMKRLGQGGPMRLLLKWLHPFTNTLRLSMVVLRTMDSSHFYRGEVFVEESMGYIGNRISHKVAKSGVDTFVAKALLPGNYFTFTHNLLPLALWFPVLLCLIMGAVRAVAPYAFSFLGSWLGRVLTRQFFLNAHHRWLPIQRIQHFNTETGREQEEKSPNGPLFNLGKKVALALAKVQDAGLDGVGMKRQYESITEQGFRLVGFGSGGYAVFESHITVQHIIQPVLLHVTPYGPSMLDVLPHYIVLEMEHSQDRRAVWFETVASLRWTGPSVVEGFAYRGSFFSPHHFAEMKETYDDVRNAYDRACNAIPDPSTGPKESPPVDAEGIKKFIMTGQVKRLQNRNKMEDQYLQVQVANIAKKLQSMMESKNGCLAPQGVILYLEGLSCSRKSSTGGLILQALNDAGYQVEQRHYNTPPTEEQMCQPWMSRFEMPDTSSLPYHGVEGGETDGGKKSKTKGEECAGDHQHTVMVWNRGPAGDFVYGTLGESSESEKCDRYREFMAFDDECFKKNILFIKLLFVTNRDAISSLIGYRLGVQNVIQDFHKWLTASYGVERANGIINGLGLRDMSNDTTDFEAYNAYQGTLDKFASFSLNTDSECNPWLVVDTADNFLAGSQLVNVFNAQIDAYARVKGDHETIVTWCREIVCPSRAPTDKFGLFGIDVSVGIVKAKQRMRMEGVIALSGVLICLYLFWLD